MTTPRQRLVEIVRERGLIRLPEPVQLRSGQWSSEFVDGKAALARGADLELACRVLLDAVSHLAFDAIGGLTMGADQFAHVGAVLSDRQWFVVRKEPKGRGTNQRVEGARITPGLRVLLVEDVVTTGGSIVQAYEVVRELGADVVAAVTLVDRGDVAAGFFADREVPYRALVTYRDLGIPPVEPLGEPVS